MRRKYALCLLVGAVLVSGCATARAGSITRAIRERSVQLHQYATIDLDFDANLVSTPRWKAPLVDCSTSEMNCFRGGELEFVAPKSCDAIRSARRGDVWTVDGVELEVLWVEPAAFPPPIHGPDPGGIYLASRERPDVAYLYNVERGLELIFYNSLDAKSVSKPVDFYAAAATGELSGWIGHASMEQIMLMNPRRNQNRLADCEE